MGRQSSAVAASAVRPASHRPIDVEEPLHDMAGSFMAAPHALTSWAMNAGPGHVCVYARVARLARGGVGERARDMAAIGLVDLLPLRRNESTGLFDYRARRTAAPFTTPPPQRQDGLSADDRMLLDLLRQHAAAGLACPSNRDLAALLGFRREMMASRGLARLRALGKINIEWSGGEAAPRRIIRIAGSDLATGEARA